MDKLRAKATFANITSVLALFVALGGTGYAISELEKNDVTSKHIKNGGVKTKDIADNAVTSPKVANGSLLGEDFAADQLPQGPQGEQGPQGAPGSALGYADVRADGTFDPDSAKNLVASKLVSGNIYCLQFATAPKNLVATVDINGAGFATATVSPKAIQDNCAGSLAATNAMVLTINGNPFVGQPKRFFVAAN